MKITDITLTLFAWDDIPPTTYGAHTGRFSGKSALGLLRLVTDEGIEGHAFLGSAMNPATTDGQGLITHLKPVLIGKDPLRREHLNQEIWKRQRSAGVRAIGAVDVALWDLVGKAMGQPIHRLLGTYRESVPAYASSAVLPSPAAYAEEAMQFKENGWAAYKIHPPTRWKEDIEVCEAVRNAVGDYTIMLDSTWSYDYPAAVRVGLAEAHDQRTQQAARRFRQRLELVEAGVGQRDEPLDLHAHPVVHQAELGKQGSQRRQLGGVAAVQRRQGGQGRQVHRGRRSALAASRGQAVVAGRVILGGA